MEFQGEQSKKSMSFQGEQRVCQTVFQRSFNDILNGRIFFLENSNKTVEANLSTNFTLSLVQNTYNEGDSIFLNKEAKKNYMESNLSTDVSLVNDFLQDIQSQYNIVFVQELSISRDVFQSVTECSSVGVCDDHSLHSTKFFRG